MDATTLSHVGPLQLIEIGFPPEAEFTGEIVRAFSDLRGHDAVRVIDALFVRKDADGNITTSVRDSDLSLHEREYLGAIVGGMLGLAAGGDQESEALGATLAAQAVADNAFGFGIGDLRAAREAIPPSSAALFLLIEHTWAVGLKQAVRGAGGVPIVQGFVTPEAVVMVGAEVHAVAEAKDTIARARIAEAVAVLDALATVQAATEVKQAAVAEAARVLLEAGLIAEAAAQDVIETLATAELIKAEALADARATVANAAPHANGAIASPASPQP